jgi:hypothetical protein
MIVLRLKLFLFGFHDGGAARTAMRWGAEYGNGVGIQGNTYAIPTKGLANC